MAGSISYATASMCLAALAKFVRLTAKGSLVNFAISGS